jgi:PPP family 3-phenylpropionic acid transporter
VSALRSRLKLLYVVLFVQVGVSVPFWAVWLHDEGLSELEISVLLALSPLVRVVGNPLVAQYADRHGALRRTLILCGALASAVAALFLAVAGFVPLLLVTLVYAFVMTPLVPLLDTMTIHAAREGRLDYGRIRVFGSASFALTAVATGALIEAHSPQLVPWLVLGALLAVTGASLLAPPDRRSEQRVAAPLRLVLRDRAFVLLVSCACTIQASHAIYYGFASVHWRGHGLGDDVVGGLWGIGVVAEILLFTFGGGLVRRLGWFRLLWIGAVTCLVRWTVMGATLAVPPLALAQTLHGITFGMVHLAVTCYVHDHIPPELSTTAQSIYSGLAGGLVFGAATFATGPLYAGFDGGAFYWMAGVAAVGLLLALAGRTALVSSPHLR